MYKGHDRVSFNIGRVNTAQPVDEIENFQSGRWVSPPEAAWRIFAFDLYEMSPAVMPLQVHCENMQTISFGPSEDLENVVSDERRSQTPLTEFFRLNRESSSDQKYLYSEFPEFFVWNERSKTWTERRRGTMVGRLTFVGPSESERFHLRLLLANVRGPVSFDDLKTVDGYRYASFQEACLARGIIEECDAAQQCLDEAISVQMPQPLRCLFATILIFCHPPNPLRLWDKYYPYLSEDFRRSYPTLEEKVLALTVEKVEQQLESVNKQLADFGLEHLKHVQNERIHLTRDVQDAYNAPLPEEYVVARKQLNMKQKEAYKAIIKAVKQGLSGAFFIDGPGGTEKTFLYCALYAKLRLMGKIVLPTASSGIAAGCLPNGRTAHSRFKLPLDYSKTLTCDVPKQGSLAALLKETAVIIWDEAPMAHKAKFQALDMLLRDLCNPDIIFGGKVVVLGGDFRQVLPVLPQKTQAEAVEASLVSSSLWPYFTRFQLEENMRAREDPAFASFLLDLKDGKLQEDEQAHVTLPPAIATPEVDYTGSVDHLIQLLFSQCSDTSFNASTFNERAILTAKNDEVDRLNSAFINNFEGERVVYKSFDTLLDDNCHIYPVEFLHTLCPGGMSPHELVLKKGCLVILLRNIDPSFGLCNGTRLTCNHFYPNMILCEIATGYFKGQQVMLPRISLRPTTSSNFPFQFARKQFPIKLSFAMTINKSQGQTLNEVGIYLRQPCFSHRQLYVALSRAKKASKVRVLSQDTASECSYNIIKNVVSFEVLSRAGII